MARSLPAILSEEEEELLKATLLFANARADVNSALLAIRNALATYARSRAGSIADRPLGERLADLQKLSRDTMHLGRFLGNADGAIDDVVRSALNAGKVAQFIDELAAISGKATAAAREVSKAMPNRGAPTIRKAELALTLELARIFCEATHIKMSANKALPYVRGATWRPKNKREAGRRFVEIVLRQVLDLTEAEVTDQTLRYWLRKAVSTI